MISGDYELQAVLLGSSEAARAAGGRAALQLPGYTCGVRVLEGQRVMALKGFRGTHDDDDDDDDDDYDDPPPLNFPQRVLRFSWVKDLAPLVIHVHLDKCLSRTTGVGRMELGSGMSVPTPATG